MRETGGTLSAVLGRRRDRWPPANLALIFRADTFARKILHLFIDSKIYQ
jgi:hypothetical protein